MARSRAYLATLLALLTMLGVAACQSTPPPAAIQVHCLPMVSYTQEDQQAAAQELAQAGPHVQALIRDYQKMRDADRACVAAGGVQ